MNFAGATKLTSLAAIVVSMTACSLIDDKADIYQESQANNVELVVPQGSVSSKDALVIPNEDKIASDSTAFELAVPIKAIPNSFSPLADLDVSWEENIIWIDTPLSDDVLRAVIKAFLVSLNGETDPISVSTDSEIVSLPIGDQNIGSLLKLYYNITRLYPDRTEYRFKLESSVNGTKVGIQHRLVSKDQNKNTDYGDWLSPDSSDETNALGLQFISAISREALAQDNSSKELAESHMNLWVTSEGQFVLKLGDQFTKDDVASLIDNSDLYLISRDPLELAFVTEGEVAKIGELRRINLPTKTKDGEELFLFNMKRKNLDNVIWQKRVYTVELVQREEGLFLEADTSATEQPDVISYRIMSALKK